jgi:hypothetical protein
MSRKREGLPWDFAGEPGGFDGGGAELEEAMQFDLSVLCTRIMYANHYKRAIRPVARHATRRKHFVLATKQLSCFCGHGGQNKCGETLTPH